jgi:hypothetical protein
LRTVAVPPPDGELDGELDPDPPPPPPPPLPFPPDLLSELALVQLPDAEELERVEGAADCVVRATVTGSAPSERATRLI